jgi:aryl-alcohol dehydrogenase-like predicted oxidoreductase
MELRNAGRLGRDLSVVGLGTWQLGADWGEVSESDATAVLQAAVDGGVTAFDTADVYGDGRSEKLIGAFVRGRSDVTVLTKMGRRVEQTLDNYSLDHFREWNDRSRANLGVDTLDLVQLHCPPDDVYASDEVFDALDGFVAEGRIARYGVSVETCGQALAAIRRPHVASVQIILNAFRMKPLDEVLPAAVDAGVAIIARVPLASGLLSGRFGHDTTFGADDHRNFNRNGEAFDVGETFAGVPYDVGVEAAQRFAAIAHDLGIEPAALALRWIIDQPGVTTVIPGASSVRQAQANAAAASTEPLDTAVLEAIRELYDESIRPLVHARW